jgi:serine/threonine protein kinase
MIGFDVSHYRMIEKLGGGGMGVVYKAEDTTLGRFVAVKFLPDDLAQDQKALERFRREARAAATLNHPNICTIFEIANHDNRWFIVMECMEGETLKHKISGKPLPLALAIELGIEISDALDVAHAEGIIHRDIKPANIFVTNRGRAKVLDFGLAKLMRLPGGGMTLADFSAMTVASEQSLSAPGTLLGTIPYMSPEQIRGEELDPRTDLYSFGTVLYEMVTGARAVRTDSTGSMIDEILHGVPTPPQRLNPSIPVDAERIIGKSMEKDRQLRYQRASEVRTDLKRLKRDIDMAEHHRAAPHAASASHPDIFNKRNTFLATVALLLITTGLAFWWRSFRTLSEPRTLSLGSVTANPPENPVYAAAISPDGKNLAYADMTGVFVRLLATGETHSLPLPENFCFR